MSDDTRPTTGEPEKKNPPKPPGRTTILTPEVRDEIVRTLEAAGTLEDAALRAGVGLSTLYAWKARGAVEESGPFREFLDAITQARAVRRLALQARMLKFAKDDWKALGFYMTHCEGGAFAPSVQVMLKEERTDAIRRLKAAFAGDPIGLARALGAIAGEPGTGGTGEASGFED